LRRGEILFVELLMMIPGKSNEFSLQSLFRVAGCLLSIGFSLAGAGCGGNGLNDTRIKSKLETGREFLNSLNFNQALVTYQVLYEDLTVSDPEWRESAFGYATCLWHAAPASEANVTRAESIFREIIEAIPESDWARISRLHLARIRMLRDFPGDPEDPEGAIPLLEELLDDPTVVRHEALLRLAECYRMDYDNPAKLQRAKEILGEWLQDYPENPFAAAMWEQIGWIELLDFENREGALEAFQRAFRLGFADPTREGELLWRIAELARATGKPKLAATYYARVITDAPSSGRGFEAQEKIKTLRDTVPGMEAVAVPELNLMFDE
jgi:tetratricopeptide (TPR) repeat protein